MKIFKNPVDFQAYCFEIRKTNTLGFVPTMGALHAGHLALVERALKENNQVAVSIFVNPLQFNNPSDLEKYPRTIEKDLELLDKAGASAVFLPEAKDIYKEKTSLTFNFGTLENVMEGKFRLGHFNGVAIVVSKLFHFALPHKAYFGQKDLQQVRIVETLVKDLSFPLELVCCDTHRETDGLAMSSRNVRLSANGRKIAPRLFEGLTMATKLVKEGKKPAEIKEAFQKFLQQYPEITLEYFEIVNYNDLQTIESIEAGNKIALCLAVFLDEVRLIDNIVMQGQK